MKLVKLVDIVNSVKDNISNITLDDAMHYIRSTAAAAFAAGNIAFTAFAVGSVVNGNIAQAYTNNYNTSVASDTTKSEQKTSTTNKQTETITTKTSVTKTEKDTHSEKTDNKDNISKNISKKTANKNTKKQANVKKSVKENTVNVSVNYLKTHPLLNIKPNTNYNFNSGVPKGSKLEFEVMTPEGVYHLVQYMPDKKFVKSFKDAYFSSTKSNPTDTLAPASLSDAKVDSALQKNLESHLNSDKKYTSSESKKDASVVGQYRKKLVAGIMRKIEYFIKDKKGNKLKASNTQPFLLELNGTSNVAKKYVSAEENASIKESITTIEKSVTNITESVTNKRTTTVSGDTAMKGFHSLPDTGNHDVKTYAGKQDTLPHSNVTNVAHDRAHSLQNFAEAVDARFRRNFVSLGYKITDNRDEVTPMSDLSLNGNGFYGLVNVGTEKKWWYGQAELEASSIDGKYVDNKLNKNIGVHNTKGAYLDLLGGPKIDITGKISFKPRFHGNLSQESADINYNGAVNNLSSITTQYLGGAGAALEFAGHEGSTALELSGEALHGRVEKNDQLPNGGGEYSNPVIDGFTTQLKAKANPFGLPLEVIANYGKEKFFPRSGFTQEIDRESWNVQLSGDVTDDLSVGARYGNYKENVSGRNMNVKNNALDINVNYRFHGK